MQTPRRDLPALIELPRGLIYTSALTCGVLAALALQIYLSRAGFDVVGPVGKSLSASGSCARRARGGRSPGRPSS